MDANPTRRVFLGVEQSATGRVWRDRLDERGNLRALSIIQRHGLPEILARVIAGRGIEPDEVEAFLDPTIRRLMPDPSSLTAMDAAAQRASPMRSSAARRSRSSATTTSTAPLERAAGVVPAPRRQRSR